MALVIAPFYAHPSYSTASRATRRATCNLNGTANGTDGPNGTTAQDLERVRTLRARENAAARLERFQEAKMARNALVAALYALPDEVRIREATEQFYSAWTNADEAAMMRRWAPHGTISTVFSLNKPAVGQKAVSEEWIMAFAAYQREKINVQYEILNVHIAESTAWAVVNQNAPSKYSRKIVPNIATIVFRRVGAEWLLLHHHSSPVVADMGPQADENPPLAQ